MSQELLFELYFRTGGLDGGSVVFAESPLYLDRLMVMLTDREIPAYIVNRRDGKVEGNAFIDGQVVERFQTELDAEFFERHTRRSQGGSRREPAFEIDEAESVEKPGGTLSR